MRIYLISDNKDTLHGLRLAGIKGEIVHERAEAKQTLNKLVKDKEIGIILVTEKVALLIKEEIKDIKLNKPYPLIVEIPDRHGSNKDNDYIMSYVKNSIGIKVWGDKMITIEEKINLFTKLVHEKVEKENREVIVRFENEYGELLNNKRVEFQKIAEDMEKRANEQIEKEKRQRLSKAHIQGRKTLLERKNKIYKKAIEDILSSIEGFRNNKAYRQFIIRSIEKVIKSNKIELFTIKLTKNDFTSLETEIKKAYKDNVDILIDDSILGGVIIFDKKIILNTICQ